MIEHVEKIAHFTVRYLNLSETFIHEQIRLMKKYEPVIFTFDKRNLDRFPAKNIYSLSDLPFLRRQEEGLRSVFGRSSYFRGLIKELDIKLMHAHFAYTGSYALQFKKYFNIPLLTSFYGLDLYKLTGSPLYRLQLKRLFRLGDHFTAYSSVMARRAMELGCPREKLTVLTVGIDLDRFKFRERKPSKDINVLFIGRLVEKKGCIFAVRAFAKSYRKHRNIRFTIGGDGPLQGEIETEIRKLGIENVARMIGPVRDTSAELEKADIFISPSVVARNGDAEGGINVAVLEALASGLPCLVTKESQSDAVFDGETGFVAKERDADDLSRKLDTLIENPQLIPKFGIIGRRKVEKLDSRVQVGKLEEIYKDLIRKYER